MTFSGKNILITGAAQGLGRAMASAFIRDGASLLLVDYSEEVLAKTAAELQQFGNVLAYSCDISTSTNVAKLKAFAEEQEFHTDIIINNAGVFSVIGPIWECDPEKWFRDTKVNMYGSFLVSHYFVPDLIAKQNGYVLNMTSAGGVGDPHAYCSSYACSKTGLMRLTEGMAEELREHNVKVFALAPPAVHTNMTRFIMDDEGGKKWRPEFKNLFQNGQNMQPEEIAQYAIELLSGKVDHLSGRYFLTQVPLAEVLNNSDKILTEDLMTLRIRKI